MEEITVGEPKRTGLLKLLGSSLGCQFVIPVYQRNYTWAADREVKQYFDDLENVLHGNYKNHFLGIIIYLEKSIDFSLRELSIIDGQQRLTTTFLIIYAIKQILINDNDIEKVQQLEGQYLTNPYHNDKIKYKLKPLVSDDNVYRCIVENRMDDITDTNVLKNYEYISNRLNELLIQGYDANAILMALNKLYVVCVPISEEDNAQKIFESINATGVKLTSADLIRNYLLMDLQSDVQEKYYACYWKKLEENVSYDSKILEMFFRMYLVIKTYILVPKNNVYREFVKWIEIQHMDIKDLFEDLLEYAKLFNLLINANIDKINFQLRDAVIDFRKINSDIPMPIVVEFCKFYHDGFIDIDTLGELIKAINAYMVRRSLCDINSQNISKLFPSVLKKVVEKCDGQYGEILKRLNQEMVGNTASTSGSYMPTDKQMMEMLLNANVYKRPALRIVLDRLELYDNPAPVDLSNLSIEHLMPQLKKDVKPDKNVTESVTQEDKKAEHSDDMTVKEAIESREHTYYGAYADIGTVLDNFTTDELIEHLKNNELGGESSLRNYVESQITSAQINRERYQSENENVTESVTPDNEELEVEAAEMRM